MKTSKSRYYIKGTLVTLAGALFSGSVLFMSYLKEAQDTEDRAKAEAQQLAQCWKDAERSVDTVERDDPRRAGYMSAFVKRCMATPVKLK